MYCIYYSDTDHFDFFCAHYAIPTLTNPNVTDHLESHQGSILSITITLSNPTKFEGGDTFFEALHDTEPTKVNNAVISGGIIQPKIRVIVSIIEVYYYTDLVRYQLENKLVKSVSYWLLNRVTYPVYWQQLVKIGAKWIWLN